MTKDVAIVVISSSAHTIGTITLVNNELQQITKMKIQELLH
jgi:hypothetical protein